jgi:hypothetical protein
MNERIKQLALKAFQPINDITSEGVADRRTFNQLWFEHYNQNFAELIVQECAKIADKAEPYKASDLIKKHFGVEE